MVSRDRGHDPLSSEATVVVHVDDINDNAPSVTVRTLHGSTETELPESSEEEELWRQDEEVQMG